MLRRITLIAPSGRRYDLTPRGRGQRHVDFPHNASWSSFDDAWSGQAPTPINDTISLRDDRRCAIKPRASAASIAPKQASGLRRGQTVTPSSFRHTQEVSLRPDTLTRTGQTTELRPLANGARHTFRYRQGPDFLPGRMPTVQRVDRPGDDDRHSTAERCHFVSAEFAAKVPLKRVISIRRSRSKHATSIRMQGH